MRMAGAVVLGTVIVQALLTAAFVLGFFWLGGWQWGLLFAGVLLLLIVLPWPGELKVVFDSKGPRAAVRIGWWGKASFRRGPDESMMVIRILGIPFRRKMEEKDEAEKPEEPQKPESSDMPPPKPPGADEQMVAEPEASEAAKKKRPWWSRVKLPDAQTVEGFSRMAGSALNASNEFIWGAEEIRVSVEDPVQRPLPDATLEQAFGSRAVGPVHVIITRADGERRVRGLYRIGLFRAAVAGLQMVLDGRGIEFARLMSEKKDKPACTGRDRKLIEEILSQQEDG